MFVTIAIRPHVKDELYVTSGRLFVTTQSTAASGEVARNHANLISGCLGCRIRVRLVESNGRPERISDQEEKSVT